MPLAAIINYDVTFDSFTRHPKKDKQAKAKYDKSAKSKSD